MLRDHSARTTGGGGAARNIRPTIRAASRVLVVTAVGLAATAPKAQAEVHMDRDLAVPMRDGTVLRADLWRPATAGRFPVLVHRTPYDRRRAPDGDPTVRRVLERGYAVLLQDVRGRYGSEGTFDPYRSEGRDGYDTIEWAAAQAWSNGRVGTFGLSYPGAVQWLAAVESPPHLEAMAPAMTFSTPRNFFYAGGVFDLSWVGWIWNHIAPDVRVRQGLAGPRTTEAAEEAWTLSALSETRVGEREMGAAAAVDYAELVLDFMDRHLRRIAGPPRPRVRAFVMGENRWLESDALPLPGTRAVPLSLASGGRLTWRASAQGHASSPLRSDPAQPIWDPFAAAYGAHDYRDLARRADVLVFETDPLDRDLRVVGAIEAAIHLSSDAPDLDLWLKVHDVSPDGTAYNLTSPGSDVVRASGSDGGAGRRLRVGEVVRLSFPNLRTGNLFRRGHRLRVVLATSFLPHFSRNLQTGRSEVESAHMRRAILHVRHEAAHPSRVVLPVVEAR